MKRLTAIDLFCGAGGFTLAAKNLDIHVLAAVEYNKNACETYNANFIKKGKPSPKLYSEDIIRLDLKEMRKDLNLKPFELDILMGGPPCQGYSTHRIKDAGVDDPRNKLLLRYFDVVREFLPKTFIVENVPGMLWLRHKKYVDSFYQFAKDEGYVVFKPVVLNAKDYGVPQNRKRVFILGYHKSLPVSFQWPPSPTHFDPKSKECLEEQEPAWLPASTVFEKKLANGDVNAVHMNHSKELIRVFKSTPKNGGSRFESCRELRCHKGHNGHKDVYGRINPKEPGPTMTTACVNPSKGRFLHPTQNHGITVRHAARFQGFPDGFFFHGGLMAGGMQVGNAVPIGLGENILDVISQALRVI